MLLYVEDLDSEYFMCLGKIKIKTPQKEKNKGSRNVGSAYIQCIYI